MAGKLFIRRRDGRIEVRLNDVGRDAIREVFAHVVASERDPDHDWHLSMNAPINPSDDHDDPLATLARQHDIATNAELSVMTLKEQFLNEAEAWAWLCTLQVALRATVVSKGILSDEKLASCEPELLDEIRLMQQFLFDLAACF
ncbi:MAG TPA: hypothetical protein VND89_05080 [Acidimicrobiales bacterium]|nr:hypothetical protein [Acidimicrobiales bacterium]